MPTLQEALRETHKQQLQFLKDSLASYVPGITGLPPAEEKAYKDALEERIRIMEDDLRNNRI